VKCTIKEVASHAGVSVATVSGLVNGNERICSASTAERIRRAISELHYVSGPTVRGASHKATRTVGVCVENSCDVQPGWDARNGYHERVWRAFIREADIADYALIHYPASVRRGESSDAFLSGRIDGLLFGARRTDDRPHALVEAGLPTVILNRASNLPAGSASVCTDEYDTASLALSHLWDYGHRRIAHLSGPVMLPLVGYGGEIPPKRCSSAHAFDPEAVPSDVASRRCEAYIAWMAGRRAYDPALLAFGCSWMYGDAEDALASWLSNDAPPTAIWCGNDDLALEVIHVARSRGLDVPRDLSVVGVDDRAVAAEASPALTSVDIPAELLGREGMRLLVRLMDDSDCDDDVFGVQRRIPISIPVTNLVVRSSTAPVAK
jgi:LacI family transcriptional regulator